MSDKTFEDLLELAQQQPQWPLADWSPSQIKHLDIRIDRHGRWYHEGSEIRRPSLVQLFSRLLDYRDDCFCLVTPAEQCNIIVEDVPFLIVEVDVRNPGSEQQVFLRTNVDDWVSLQRQSQFELKGVVPYVEVRPGLWARVSRSCYYQLFEYLELPDESAQPVCDSEVCDSEVCDSEVWNSEGFIREIEEHQVAILRSCGAALRWPLTDDPTDHR